MNKRTTVCYALILVFSVFIFKNGISQVTDTKNRCLLDCEYTEQDFVNVQLAHLRMEDHAVRIRNKTDVVTYPLRIAIVQKSDSIITLSEETVRTVLYKLNNSFKETGFAFYLQQVDIIRSDLSIEDLSANQFNLYETFSAEHDIDNLLTIYVLDHAKDFCDITPTSVRCGRTGGFSFVLSDRAQNIVMSRFDLLDEKIMAHEMGHFFGLFHTFEEHMFGKDNFADNQCHSSGDRICDTPPDPGTIYEVYVNYSSCEMIGLRSPEGDDYQPLINNYMSYYKPCYLKEYTFTQGQIDIMRAASELPIRSKYAR